MKPERIYFSPPNIGEEEINRVVAALRSGWVAPVGPELDAFEEALSARMKDRSVLALNSGTSALHLAIILAGVVAGDRVIVGSMTFVAAANAVLYERALPVFLDSEPDSWNLDPALLEQYLSTNCKVGRLPKAIIVTHIYGRAACMKEIMKICKRYDVIVIEDAAEAFGTTKDGEPAGSIGDFGVLSFNGNKIITTSGGGALVCKSESDYSRAKHLATQSKSVADHYLHHERGFNYRMSNILAAIGLGQLSRFEAILKTKRNLSEFYRQALAEIHWLENAPEVSSNDWVFPVLIKQKCLNQVNSSQLVSLFEEQNIEARRFWKPLHSQPLFQGAKQLLNGVSDDLFDRGICLPSGSAMSADQTKRVIEVLTSIRVE